MPPSLGGFAHYRKTLRLLRRGDRGIPRFWRNDLERGTISQSFDFSEYRKETEILEASATSAWARRDYSTRNWTEFGLSYRMVTFRWAQATLREHIISNINRLFRQLSIKCELGVSGLPSAADILKLRKEMTEGHISFAKAIDGCSTNLD